MFSMFSFKQGDILRCIDSNNALGLYFDCLYEVVRAFGDTVIVRTNAGFYTVSHANRFIRYS